MTQPQPITSFMCDFKVVYTEIKHKINIPTLHDTTSIADVLTSVKCDIRNKFAPITDCNIIHGDDGETGNPIEYSQEPAKDIFKPTDIFYIHPIEDMDICSDDEEDCDCPVCYTTISGINRYHARFFQCEHEMCCSCHERLTNRICPMCRAPSRTEYELDNNINHNNNNINHNNNNINHIDNNINHNNNIIDNIINN